MPGLNPLVQYRYTLRYGYSDDGDKRDFQMTVHDGS
jgi:hypothetical protein